MAEEGEVSGATNLAMLSVQHATASSSSCTFDVYIRFCYELKHMQNNSVSEPLLIMWSHLTAFMLLSCLALEL